MTRRTMAAVPARSATALGLVAAVTTAGLAAAAPAAATAPSLTAKAVFGAASYVSGQTISVRLSVHNSGTSSATGITASQDFAPGQLAVGPGGFGVFDRGATIAAGHTVSVTVSGHLADPSASTVTFSGNLFGRDGLGVAAFSTTAPVRLRTATVRGVVFGDANANGRPDAREARPGARLRFAYLYGNKTFAVTANSDGRYRVTLPRGSYFVSGGTKRWTVIPPVIIVGAKDVADDLRAVRPLGRVLTVSLHFTKHRYAVHDRAHVVITLHNTGSAPLRGIAPSCNRVGDASEIVNVGRGWGSLAIGRAGTTLAPHGTRTFHVTSRVPRAALDAGSVVVACDFGYPNVETGYRPTARDVARVPGEFGALAGEITHPVAGKPGVTAGLGNVRVVLVDRTVCPLFVRKTVTDAEGHFRMGHLPAGSSYQLYLFAPAGWRVPKPDPSPAFVFGKDTIHLFIEAEPGATRKPRLPTSCG